MRDPANAPLVNDPVTQMIQVQQFVSFVNTREEAEASTIYVQRMREEMCQLYVQQISTSTKVNTFVTVEAFRELLRLNRKFLDLN
jgi:hypothetical protein